MRIFAVAGLMLLAVPAAAAPGDLPASAAAHAVDALIASMNGYIDPQTGARMQAVLRKERKRLLAIRDRETLVKEVNQLLADSRDQHLKIRIDTIDPGRAAQSWGAGHGGESPAQGRGPGCTCPSTGLRGQPAPRLAASLRSERRDGSLPSAAPSVSQRSASGAPHTRVQDDPRCRRPLETVCRFTGKKLQKLHREASRGPLLQTESL